MVMLSSAEFELVQVVPPVTAHPVVGAKAHSEISAQSSKSSWTSGSIIQSNSIAPLITLRSKTSCGFVKFVRYIFWNWFCDIFKFCDFNCLIDFINFNLWISRNLSCDYANIISTC